MFKAVDSGCMAIGKFYLHGVVPYCRCALGRYARLKHRQHGAWSVTGARRGYSCFLLALVIAQSARTIFPQVREIEVARVAVGPCNVNALARCDAHFHVHRFLSHIVWYRHCSNSSRVVPIPLCSCQLICCATRFSKPDLSERPSLDLRMIPRSSNIYTHTRLITT